MAGCPTPLIVKYTVAKEGHVQLVVYDSLGGQVKVFLDTNQKPGYYAVKFGVCDIAGGVYYYRIHAGDFAKVKKLVLMK
jgi:hypothetical protein